MCFHRFRLNFDCTTKREASTHTHKHTFLKYPALSVRMHKQILGINIRKVHVMQSKLAIQLIGSAQPLSAGPLVREIELHCLPLLLYGLIPLPLQQVLPIVNSQFKSDKYGPMLDQATLRFAEIQLAEQSNSEAGNTQPWRLICD